MALRITWSLPIFLPSSQWTPAMLLPRLPLHAAHPARAPRSLRRVQGAAGLSQSAHPLRSADLGCRDKQAMAPCHGLCHDVYNTTTNMELVSWTIQHPCSMGLCRTLVLRMKRFSSRCWRSAECNYAAQTSSLQGQFRLQQNRDAMTKALWYHDGQLEKHGPRAELAGPP